MASKKDIERLLKKGSFTGLEAARLIIGHFVEIDHDRPGFLSEREISYIKSRLTSTTAAEYNRWIETYRIIDRTLQEAHVQELEAERIVSLASHELKRYYLEHLLRIQVVTTPAIVTEKQYQDIKARQREELLRSLYPLQEVFQNRAYELASEGMKEEALYDRELLVDQHPELYSLAVDQILKLRETGQLQILRGEEYNERIEALLAKKQQEGSLSNEEMDQLLANTYLSGEQLYQTGLPEWIAWIDEVKAGFQEGDPVGNGYAILQQPKPDQVDERGYYKEDRFQWLQDISGLKAIKERWKERGLSLEEMLETTHKAIRTRVRNYLGLQSVVETVSEVLGVDFAEDLREWYQQLQSQVDYYNTLIRKDAPYSSDIPKLAKIRIDNLKPTASSLRYFRDRIALGLGDNWWQEAIQVVEFPTSEEETPGEKEPEEVEHGQEA